jgi:hypothetical protein
VFVSLADASYDEHVHGPLPVPQEGQGGGTVKARIEQVINTEAGGGDLKELRGLMNKTLNFANGLQHHKDPGNVEAIICADATIMVATSVRRLVGSRCD